MTARDLKEQLKRHFAQQSLPEALEQRLLEQALISPQSPIELQAPKKKHLWRALALAVVALSSLVFWWAGSAESMAERVATEVSANHLKALDSDFNSEELPVLQRKMGKLDFSLVAPGSSRVDGLSLEGGRYCSIRGQVAAQLKWTAADGSRHTLYQTRATESLKQAAPSEVLVDGLKLQLWEQAGVLNVLASPQ